MKVLSPSKFASTSESSTESPQKTPKKYTRDVNVPQYVENESIAILRDAMLRAPDLDNFSNNELEHMFWHLRDYSYFCGVKGFYEEALETEKLLKFIHLELTDRNISTTGGQSTDSFKTEVQNKEGKWINALIAFDEETEKRQITLQQRIEYDMKQFERQWQSSRLRQYQKQSPKLRDMIASEKSLAASGHFAEASELKKQVEARKQEEFNEAQRLANQEYVENKQRLAQKQRAEMANMLDTRRHQREALIQKQRKEMEAIEVRSRLLLDKAAKSVVRGKISLPETGLLRAFIAREAREADKTELLPMVTPPRMFTGKVSELQERETRPFTKCVPKTRHSVGVDTGPGVYDVKTAMQSLKEMYEEKTKRSFDYEPKVDLPDVDLTISPIQETSPMRTPKKKPKERDVRSEIKASPPVLSPSVKLSASSIMQKFRAANKHLFPEEEREPPTPVVAKKRIKRKKVIPVEEDMKPVKEKMHLYKEVESRSAPVTPKANSDLLPGAKVLTMKSYAKYNKEKSGPRLYREAGGQSVEISPEKPKPKKKFTGLIVSSKSIDKPADDYDYYSDSYYYSDEDMTLPNGSPQRYKRRGLAYSSSRRSRSRKNAALPSLSTVEVVTEVIPEQKELVTSHEHSFGVDQDRPLILISEAEKIVDCPAEEEEQPEPLELSVVVNEFHAPKVPLPLRKSGNIEVFSELPPPNKFVATSNVEIFSHSAPSTSRCVTTESVEVFSQNARPVIPKLEISATLEKTARREKRHDKDDSKSPSVHQRSVRISGFGNEPLVQFGGVISGSQRYEPIILDASTLSSRSPSGKSKTRSSGVQLIKH